ncbi:hypothetical protein D1AOALGA4SA_1570 [Olavius algarvensis Delta 1 endosymbiont]|nr:hypothetical protein D1AOALGA4SA_1570 [Olavius algarvensis Delta 1 endosymbiont]
MLISSILICPFLPVKQEIRNKSQNTNYKSQWFDKLTTLSQFEGQ